MGGYITLKAATFCRLDFDRAHAALLARELHDLDEKRLERGYTFSSGISCYYVTKPLKINGSSHTRVIQPAIRFDPLGGLGVLYSTGLNKR